MYCLLKTQPFHGQCVGIQNHDFLWASSSHYMRRFYSLCIKIYTVSKTANIRNIYFTTRKVPGHRKVWVQIVKIFWNCSFNYIWLNIQKELWSVCIVHIWAYHRENIIIGFIYFILATAPPPHLGKVVFSDLPWAATACRGLPCMACLGLTQPSVDCPSLPRVLS